LERERRCRSLVDERGTIEVQGCAEASARRFPLRVSEGRPASLYFSHVKPSSARKT
jgi:hypothetical protein